jgi:hypothetical protein
MLHSNWSYSSEGHWPHAKVAKNAKELKFPGIVFKTDRFVC